MLEFMECIVQRSMLLSIEVSILVVAEVLNLGFMFKNLRRQVITFALH